MKGRDNSKLVSRSPLTESPANSGFRNGLIRFIIPFSSFREAYLRAPWYRKVNLLIGCLISGLSSILLGEVEIGLGLLMGYGLLGSLLVYVIVSLTSGFLVLPGVDAFFVILVLILAFFALWYAGLSKNVGDNIRLNEKKKLAGSYVFRFFRSQTKKIEAFFERYNHEWSASGKKNKTFLALSWFVCGFPLFFYDRALRGLIYLLSQLLFISYMIARGASDLLGLFTLHQEGVASSNTMVYGILASCFLIAFLAIYVMNLRSTLMAVEEDNEEIHGPGFKNEAREYANGKFYVSALIIPVVGALLFTVIPLCFMILVAFTNYSGNQNWPGNLIPAPNLDKYLSWIGTGTFARLFGDANNLKDMLTVFSWTMIWALLATFTCYFGGLFFAMLLNKKCIKGKVIYRSLLVVSMALPQFVSLLVMRTMFANNGAVNKLLLQWGFISWLQQAGWISSLDNFVAFWSTPVLAKALVILINMWVGIPYYMLLMSGLLINVPSDFYDAAKIEGASRSQIFRKITFPYILFMTTPCLITSFVSNINNFNVIWFLTGTNDAKADQTDILITWLYKITIGSQLHDYNFGAAIGIVMFVITASVSLIVYRRSSSYKNEEEFR